MGRNNKDFEACPQCYGNGTTGAPNYANTCTSCSGTGKRTEKQNTQTLPPDHWSNA